MKPKFVTIKKDDTEARCLASATDVWARHGWTVVDDGSSESGAQPVTAEASPNPEPTNQNEGGDQ